MQLEKHETADTVTVRGGASKLQHALENEDPSMGYMLLGFITAMNSFQKDELVVDLTQNDPSDRPLEVKVIFDEHERPKTIETRFLDTEKEVSHG